MSIARVLNELCSSFGKMKSKREPSNLYQGYFKNMVSRSVRDETFYSCLRGE